jgi:hypothetical protein
MWEHAGTIATIASFIATAIGMLVTVTWRLGNVVIELKDAIAKARDEVEARQDVYVRQIGETIQALRQKVSDVELDTAKTYMRRESFYSIKAEMTVEIKELGKELKDRLTRMEEKIDHRAAG